MDNIVALTSKHDSATSATEGACELVRDPWATFDAFWTCYPRHEAKKDARKAWARLNPSEQVAAVVAAADWRQVWRAQGRESHLIPLPATWLRGERWEDEVPEGILGARHGSHAPALLSAKLPVAQDIPERVKALLARLRKPGGPS